MKKRISDIMWHYVKITYFLNSPHVYSVSQAC